MKKYTCEGCKGLYPDELMADWTICRGCMQAKVGDDKYIDSLGIVWSPEELAEAGGIEEVESMCSEADIRRNHK